MEMKGFTKAEKCGILAMIFDLACARKMCIRDSGVTALFHFIQQFCKDRLRADHPFCLCIADTYSTLFSEKKQHNLFGHAELLLHRADFFVARKPGV